MILHLGEQIQRTYENYCLVNNATAASDHDETDIKIYHINPTTRNLYITPEASIYKDILTVSFDASGVYSLHIENGIGETVYTSTLPANGMEYDYDLSGIGEGFFILTIDGPSGEYEGEFSVN